MYALLLSSQLTNLIYFLFFSSFFLPFDHFYSTRKVGPNMKLVIMPFAIPFVFIAAVFGIALSPLYALCFALFYPGIVTVDIKRQSAWRRTWLWAGWQETFFTTQENLVTYFYVCTKGVPDELRKLRRRTYTKRQEIYPLDWFVAIVFFFLLGGVLSAVSMAIIVAIKLPLIAFRAFANHFRTTNDWFRSPALIFAWFLGLVFIIPLGIALAVPLAIFWGLYKGGLSASMIMTRHMDVVASKASRKIDIAQAESLSGSFSYYVDAPLDSLLTAVKNIHIESTRYILRQDVPFLVLESKVPISIPWLVLGLIASIIGVICVIPVMLTVILMSIVPVLMSMWGKLIQFMSTSNGQKSYTFPFAFLGLALALPAAPISLVFCFIRAILDALSAFLVVHSKRSLVQGIQYALGVNYIWEYHINKFAFAMHNGDQVHWASVLPYAFGIWAMPYMDSAEWDQGGPIYPIGIVVRQPRFLPPGLRRPKLSQDGRVLDMTSAAYKIPGGTASMPDPSITQIAVDGSLRMPVPLHEMKPLPICYDGGNDIHPFSLGATNQHSSGSDTEKKPLYGVELLPGAYRAALFELAREAMRLAAHLPDDVTLAAVLASAPNAQAVAAAFGDVLKEQPVHNDTVSHSAFDLVQNQGGLPPLLIGVSFEDGHELEIMARSAGLHHAHMLQYMANQALRQMASPKKINTKKASTKTVSPAAKRKAIAAASKANEAMADATSPKTNTDAIVVNVAAVDEEEEGEEEDEEEVEANIPPPVIVADVDDQLHLHDQAHETAVIQAQKHDVNGFLCCSCMHHDGYDDYDEEEGNTLSNKNNNSASNEAVLEEASAAIAASNSPLKQASSREILSKTTGDLLVTSESIREVGKKKVELLKNSSFNESTTNSSSEASRPVQFTSSSSSATNVSASSSSASRTAIIHHADIKSKETINEEEEEEEEEKRVLSAHAAIEEANKAMFRASTAHQAALQLRTSSGTSSSSNAARGGISSSSDDILNLTPLTSSVSEGSIGALAVGVSATSLLQTAKPEIDVSRSSNSGIRIPIGQSSNLTASSESSQPSSIPASAASNAYVPATSSLSPPIVPDIRASVSPSLSQPPLSPSRSIDDEDDEPFVLSAVSHPELPDVWVKVGGVGQESYFVNYARAQSTWKLPEGLPVKLAETK
jgi:hypothetical protein